MTTLTHIDWRAIWLAVSLIAPALAAVVVRLGGL
jgi:hypothetical protein